MQFANCHPPCPGEHPATIPVDDNVDVFVRSCSWTTTLCPSSLCSKVVSPQVVRNYHVFTTNIGEAMKIWNNAWSRLSNMSVLLESSREATVHDTLDYFLRLLYDKLERGPKRRVGSYTMFNTFVNTFRRKLLMLLDDVEQFFL